MPTTGFHQRDIETMPRPQLEALQLERLQSTIASLRTNVPVMAERIADVADLTTLDDLANFPFLRKTDLRDNYPFGLFAVPREQLARVHASSGTTGKPTVVGYTSDDLQVWADCVARCLRGAGIEPGQMLHNAYGYGLFTGGLGLHDGATEAGLNVIPVSGGNTERQLMLLEDFAPEAICCTPSYALTLAELLGDAGPGCSLQVGLLGAEPWSNATREAIEAGLGIIAVNIYGLSEVIGPGVSCETADRDGLVIMEDHFLPEIVDPDTGERLPDGEVGVLVLTSLTKQAFPVLRYWTGDLCSITREPAVCGRTHARMSPLVGRADDMLIIRGINVYPREIEAVLMDDPDVGANYAIVVDRRGPMVELRIRAEATADAADRLSIVRDRVAGALAERIRIRADLELVPAGSMPRTEVGKVQRVFEQVDDVDPLA